MMICTWFRLKETGTSIISELTMISSNQKLQPTATRCASTFFMIKTGPEIFSRAPGSRG